MLGKLLKYELIATGRRLPLLYGVLLAISALFGVIIGSGAFDNAIVGRISTTLYVMAAVTLGLLTLIILIQRFYKNLLGNEGYLMMTLPAGPGAHVASKIISSAMWVILGGITGFLAFSIMLYFITHGDTHWFGIWKGLAYILKTAGQTSGGVLFIIEILVLVILISAEIVAKVYAAIAIGHQWSNHRALGAVLAYVGISVIETVASVPLQSVFNEEEMIFDTFPEMIRGMQEVLFHVILLGAALLAIYWFITWILVKKRLNLQ